MAAIAISPTKVPHQCKGCGASFYPKRTDRRSYCSRQCARDHRAMVQLQARVIERARVVTFHRPCDECGRRFTARQAAQRVCGDECRAARARRRARERNERLVGVKSHVCTECGVTFSPAYGNKSRSFCSAECARTAERRSKPRGSDRKRARAYGVKYEYVNPLKVLRRDNWTCQLCGRKTPKELRGTFDPRAPEVDHIMPISRGGAHTYANLQCACRACNIAKGDTPKGQHQLFA